MRRQSGINQLFFGAEYTGIDYAAVGARTAVGGAAAGGAGFLATAGAGAVLGSEVPIVGNIIGFGVGALVYFLVDNSIGDDIETAVRKKMGEYGCEGGHSNENDRRMIVGRISGHYYL